MSSVPLVQKQAVQGLTLKGSAAVVKDYLSFAINSIFYQRDVYEPNEFNMVKKYGLSLMIMKNENELETSLKDVEKALSDKALKRLILMLYDDETDETIEKWEFCIENEETNNNTETGTKSITDVQADIRAILKQVLGSVSFLPVIKERSKVKFVLTVKSDYRLPNWFPYTGSLAVDNGEEFEFKEFSTSFHKCGTKVTYKS